MKLEIATYKATKFAIMNFHYSKTMPTCGCSFSVFNDAKEWCGVIVYSKGASNKIAMPYNLVQGQVIELVRVALNGKQESTSKAVSISLNLVKKLNPLVKLIISFADTGQNHLGINTRQQIGTMSEFQRVKPPVICTKKQEGSTITETLVTADLRIITPSGAQRLATVYKLKALINTNIFILLIKVWLSCVKFYINHILRLYKRR